MTETANLSGDWSGEYYMSNRPHPISAALVQAEGELTGSMRDALTDRTTSVFEIAAEAGFPPGADEQIEAQLRALIPDRTRPPIEYVSHLPEDSLLAGWIEGTKVYFLKAYQGVSFGGYRVGDKLVGHQTEGHVVHYSGTLGHGGREIEGRWWIDADPEAGTRRSEGSFTLRKDKA